MQSPFLKFFLTIMKQHHGHCSSILVWKVYENSLKTNTLLSLILKCVSLWFYSFETDSIPKLKESSPYSAFLFLFLISLHWILMLQARWIFLFFLILLNFQSQSLYSTIAFWSFFSYQFILSISARFVILILHYTSFLFLFSFGVGSEILFVLEKKDNSFIRWCHKMAIILLWLIYLDWSIFLLDCKHDLADDHYNCLEQFVGVLRFQSCMQLHTPLEVCWDLDLFIFWFLTVWIKKELKCEETCLFVSRT